jgi:hypothetical protein
MYVTYLIIYCGEKLPPFYIGSTSLNKIENGYRGSVRSKKYSEIFKRELKDNFDLFNVLIFSKHINRKDAYETELKLQKYFNVVKSKYFYNQALASAGGMAGMDISGKNNPMYGKKHSEEAKRKISEKRGHDKRYNITDKHKEITRITHLGKIVSEETRKKLSEAGKGRIVNEETKQLLREKNGGFLVSEETRKKISKGNKGKIISEETRKKISVALKNRIVNEETKQLLREKNGGFLVSEETRKKISDSKKGKKRFFSQEWRNNISKGNKGRIVSEETRKKLNKSRNSKKLICPHCEFNGGGGNMKRYHFDNCKHKT